MSKDKPDTWMPLVIGDYLKDTTRLSTEQHGAYLLIIMSYWVDGPPLDDDGDLAAITGLDLKSWRKHREKLARFFRIEDGVWLHKRIDEELDRWAHKKAAYVARAAAGGHAKAAKSTPQAAIKQAKMPKKSCLKAAPQPASPEVEPIKGSTLWGRLDADAHADGAPSPSAWKGPATIRDAFVDALGEPWCRKFLDACRWQDGPDRALIPPHRTIGSRILKDAMPLLAKMNLALLEKAA